MPADRSFVVVAEFLARPGRAEELAGRFVAHAAKSRTEPGCRVFDICRDGDRFLLYEVYDDEAAYAAHRATAHYEAFRQWGPALLLPAAGGAPFQRRRVWQRLD